MRTSTVIAVMSSLYRPSDPNITRRSIESAAQCSVFDQINVHGYTPAWSGRPKSVVQFPIPSTPVHAAYRWLRNTDVPTEVLASATKREIVDSVARSQWRSQVCLDAWHVLNVSAGVVIWLENDGIVNCGRLQQAVDQFLISGQSGASCYSASGLNTHQSPQHTSKPQLYTGHGAVCMMFRGSNVPQIRRHILGYHMVQPLDWILSDFSGGTWQVYDAVSHGVPGKRHASTRV